MSRILCHQQLHDHVHGRTPLVPIQSQINPLQFPSHLLQIHSKIVFLSTSSSLKLFLSLTFPHQNHLHSLLSRIHDTWLVRLIVCDVITRILVISTDREAPEPDKFSPPHPFSFIQYTPAIFYPTFSSLIYSLLQNMLTANHAVCFHSLFICFL